MPWRRRDPFLDFVLDFSETQPTQHTIERTTRWSWCSRLCLLAAAAAAFVAVAFAVVVAIVVHFSVSLANRLWMVLAGSGYGNNNFSKQLYRCFRCVHEHRLCKDVKNTRKTATKTNQVNLIPVVLRFLSNSIKLPSIHRRMQNCFENFISTNSEPHQIGNDDTLCFDNSLSVKEHQFQNQTKTNKYIYI